MTNHRPGDLIWGEPCPVLNILDRLRFEIAPMGCKQRAEVGEGPEGAQGEKWFIHIAEIWVRIFDDAAKCLKGVPLAFERRTHTLFDRQTS